MTFSEWSIAQKSCCSQHTGTAHKDIHVHTYSWYMCRYTLLQPASGVSQVRIPVQCRKSVLCNNMVPLSYAGYV